MSEHTNVTCAHCCVTSFSGIRYKCYICSNYNLCDACIDTVEKNQLHQLDHYFLRLKNSPVCAHPSSVLPDLTSTADPVPQVYTDRSMWHHKELCHSCSGHITGYRYFCSSCCVSFCAQCEFSRLDSIGHDWSHSLLKMPPPPSALSATAEACILEDANPSPTTSPALHSPAPTLEDYGVTFQQLKVTISRNTSHNINIALHSTNHNLSASPWIGHVAQRELPPLEQ